MIGPAIGYVVFNMTLDSKPAGNQHIAQLDDHDCFDASMAAVGNNNALFVTLKPGVVYQENVGSFVDDVPARPAKQP